MLDPRRRYFLPPIIFYAGLSVKKKKFFRNFASIATLGILGTYILFAVIALGLFAISKLPNLLNLTVRTFICFWAWACFEAGLVSPDHRSWRPGSSCCASATC